MKEYGQVSQVVAICHGEIYYVLGEYCLVDAIPIKFLATLGTLE